MENQTNNPTSVSNQPPIYMSPQKSPTMGKNNNKTKSLSIILLFVMIFALSWFFITNKKQFCSTKYRINKNQQSIIRLEDNLITNLNNVNLIDLKEEKIIAKSNKMLDDQLFEQAVYAMMLDGTITPFAHLYADVCLIDKQPASNNTGILTHNYQIDHYYCTNKCTSGIYQVSFSYHPNDGNFTVAKNY